MDTNDKIIKWLKVTALPFAYIAKKTGVSRATLHNWVKGSHHIRKRNRERVLFHFKEDIRLTLGDKKLKIIGGSKTVFKPNINKDLSKDTGEIDANYVIDLQKNEINRLSEENKSLNTDLRKLKSTENSLFEEITQYDLKTITKLSFTFKGVMQTIEQGEKVANFGKLLGYSEDEMKCYFLMGQEFKMKEHPYNNILHKESISYIDSLLKTLPQIFNALKNMMGNHYIPVPITFIHKNGEHINTICSCNVDWYNFRVTTKCSVIS